MPSEISSIHNPLAWAILNSKEQNCSASRLAYFFVQNKYQLIIWLSYLMCVICFSGIGGNWKNQYKKEITWNRFINTHGGEGKNVPMDRYNEFLNADFKGNLLIRKSWYVSHIMWFFIGFQITIQNEKLTVWKKFYNK